MSGTAYTDFGSDDECDSECDDTDPSFFVDDAELGE